ncbi:hypothetical protein J6590_068440 [Homalodisca vitripennis]|nr:hypothetical protein J6590_068440 [Homalodisca vitripennis]
MGYPHYLKRDCYILRALVIAARANNPSVTVERRFLERKMNEFCSQAVNKRPLPVTPPPISLKPVIISPWYRPIYRHKSTLGRSLSLSWLIRQGSPNKLYQRPPSAHRSRGIE